MSPEIGRDLTDASGDRQVERLRAFIWFDCASTGVSAITLLLAYVAVLQSPYLLFVMTAVMLAAGLMAIGLRPIRRDRLDVAVFWVAIANWGIALVASAIATFAWPILSIAALIPAVLAAPYVSGRRLRWYLGVSLAVSVGAAMLGLLQDFSGLSGELPHWIRPLVVIGFLPLMGGMVAQIALQNSTRTQTALAEALAANQHLKESRLALSKQADALRASRARVVAATDRERRRIERDLHDGAQQRLARLTLQLRTLRELCEASDANVTLLIEALRCDVHAAQAELRTFAQGIYPTVLTDCGLVPALDTVADRCPIPVQVIDGTVGRVPAEVEAAIYFCCAEALQNAGKHAGPAATARIEIGRDTEGLRFEVVDDGVGFSGPRRGAGSGLINMEDRIGAIGGRLEIESSPACGTRVRGLVPFPRLFDRAARAG